MTVPPAVGALTNLPVADLERWVVEMRKVAALSGRSAVDAADVLIWGLTQWLAGRTTGNEVAPDAPEGSDAAQDAAYSRWMVAEDIGRLAETVTRLRGAQAAGVLQPWDGPTLARQADNVGHLAGKEARESMADDIAAARAEALTLAAEIEVSSQRQQLVAYGQKVIANASSVAGIVGGIARAVAELRRLGALTTVDETTARAGVLRAVRYRAARRLEEAEVASAGGSLAKAEKLRREAAVLLAQDWARAGLEGTPTV